MTEHGKIVDRLIVKTTNDKIKWEQLATYWKATSGEVGLELNFGRGGHSLYADSIRMLVDDDKISALVQAVRENLKRQIDNKNDATLNKLWKSLT